MCFFLYLMILWLPAHKYFKDYDCNKLPWWFKWLCTNGLKITSLNMEYKLWFYIFFLSIYIFLSSLWVVTAVVALLRLPRMPKNTRKLLNHSRGKIGSWKFKLLFRMVMKMEEKRRNKLKNLKLKKIHPWNQLLNTLQTQNMPPWISMEII